ncbi:hypothetical protein E2C01_089708 [Portunus trituberculatus]|uniref:Uncharacterized protein n=1 Tax=Portunus trituberculatus TaxID=210409 RepID=A0A5B7JIZ7_PORTR|nr:hypothetical protein [Portunus trituberculatus]
MSRGAFLSAARPAWKYQSFPRLSFIGKTRRPEVPRNTQTPMRRKYVNVSEDLELREKAEHGGNKYYLLIILQNLLM